MNVLLEAKLITDTLSNRYKGLNLRKEIINFKKRVVVKRSNDEYEARSSAKKSNSTQCARTQTSMNIRKQSPINFFSY